MIKKKVNYISVLSGISCFAVVMLHSNGAFWAFSKERYWITSNLIECLMYFAVPIFFMISGSTLIDYRDKYSTKEYFKKRIMKTVIPFIAWSFIGLLYQFIVGGIEFNGGLPGIKSIIGALLNTDVIGVYWFFIPLFSMYLCIPFISLIPKDNRKKIFQYCVCLCAVLNLLIPFMCNVFGFDYSNRVTLPICSGYVFYIMIGYLLNTSELKLIHRIMIYILGIIGLLMHFAGTYYLSMDANQIIQTYKGYNNVPAVLYSIAVFVLFKQIVSRLSEDNIVCKTANAFGKYTFSIYLIHWFVLQILTKIFELNTLSIVYRVGMPFIVIPICILIAFILKKIPILCRIVP